MGLLRSGDLTLDAGVATLISVVEVVLHEFLRTGHR